MKKVLILLGFVIFVIGFLTFTSQVIHPSYASLKAKCYIAEEDFEKEGIVVMGMTEISEAGNVTITLYTDDIKTKKHELCHVTQYQQKRLNTCAKPFSVFIDEVECNTAEYLPMFVYDKIYYWE